MTNTTKEVERELKSTLEIPPETISEVARRWREEMNARDSRETAEEVRS